MPLPHNGMISFLILFIYCFIQLKYFGSYIRNLFERLSNESIEHVSQVDPGVTSEFDKTGREVKNCKLELRNHLGFSSTNRCGDDYV
jgi:hypothetical protein